MDTCFQCGELITRPARKGNRRLYCTLHEQQLMLALTCSEKPADYHESTKAIGLQHALHELNQLEGLLPTSRSSTEDLAQAVGGAIQWMAAELVRRTA